MNIKIVKNNSIEDFLESSGERLHEKESFHNLILGLAYRIRDKQIEPTDPLYYSIEVDGKIIANALRAEAKKPLIVTEIPLTCVDALIKELSSEEIELAAVVGEEKTATYFKGQWTSLKNLDSRINMHLGIYECFNVIFPKTIAGELIEATNDHKMILKKFITGFIIDCFPSEPSDEKNVEKVLKRNLDNKALFLLKNSRDEIVSMAANIRSTLNSGTISFVYTPPEFRGLGYGSSVVSLLADHIMKNGKTFSNLFTDLTNPTSNSIYQKVGFTKIGQNIHFDFIKK